MTDAFYETFPYYLHIGMPSAEFWEGSAYLTKAYYKKHILDMDEKNEMLWLQGLYNYNAIATAISNIHFDDKQHKANKYMEEPLRIRPLTEEEKEAERKKAQDKVVAQLDSIARAFNKKKNSEV